MQCNVSPFVTWCGPWIESANIGYLVGTTSFDVKAVVLVAVVKMKIVKVPAQSSPAVFSSKHTPVKTFCSFLNDISTRYNTISLVNDA